MDLYINATFSGAKEIKSNLDNLKLFENVFLINYQQCNKEIYNITKKNKGVNRFAKYLIFKKKLSLIFNSYSPIKIKYDRMVIPYLHYELFSVISTFVNGVYFNNKNVAIDVLEEGVGSYNIVDSKSKIQVAIRKTIGFLYVPSMKFNYYVYKPELIKDHKFKKISLKKLNPVEKNEKVIKTYNKIFGYKEKYSICNEYKFVYLEQDLKTFKISKQNVLEIINVISGKCGQENFIVKMHPRSKENIFNGNIFNQFSVPWELITLNNKLPNNVLISVLSTACLTPKLLFDEEPIVILLYKLFKEDLEFASEQIRLAESVKKTYRQNKFFIPSDVEELKEILSFIDR
ncbi:hypothetical protein [Salirhabdus salicampi]|uniref:hypothetical protein n=1 Tax=Salirhabdus salicampi TaxID=476102 RepID=UPI0020C28081|nr:hypothetical protein [Salirhabdus salicampi]MCP8617527.1 hypothetical protein [Salirhabdus salicampi]